MLGALVASAAPEPRSARVDRLIEKLTDEEHGVRTEARGELIRIGTPAWDALTKAARSHPDLEARMQARWALKAIFPLRVERLITDLGDKSLKKRDDARGELLRLLQARDAVAEDALVRASALHRDALSRQGAEALVSKFSARRIDGLIEQLGDEKFENREEAHVELRGLGRFALGPLKAAQKHQDLEVARRAKQIVREIEGR